MGKAEETKKSIIEKSAVVFNKNGFQRTSMSTLTEALGLTKGAIYGHFTDKDDLAVEAFRFSVERIRRRIAERVGEREGAAGKLRAYAESFVVFFEEVGNSGGCPILNTAADSDDTHPQLLDEVRRALMAWEESVVRLVELGKSAGELRLDADPRAFAAYFGDSGHPFRLNPDTDFIPFRTANKEESGRRFRSIADSEYGGIRTATSTREAVPFRA